jgi:hypothetical protein
MRHSQQQLTPMTPPNTGLNRPVSEPPTGSRPRRHQKGEKNYLHTDKNKKVKPEQLKLSKTEPSTWS